LRLPRFSWPRGLREAVLALAVAMTVFFVPAMAMRDLETASLDLRFRLRGVEKAEPETVVVLVDERSLEALGRWPLNRRLFGKAVQLLDADGAKVIAFDLLFPEPDRPISDELRKVVRAAAGGLADTADAGLRQTLKHLADDNPDADFAAAIKASGKVLLPLAFTFQGPEEDTPPALAPQVYAKLDQSETEPYFPLQPHRVLMPVSPLAEAAAALGHVNIAFDRDGTPRYDYLALPFSGDFVPSIAVRIAAAYRGVKWDDVGLALGDGLHLGDKFVPTDPAMRLVVNYRGPRGTIPTYSFVDLLQGKLSPDLFKGRNVLIGASFVGIADSYGGPFGNTPIPGTERLADIVDTILSGDFILENPPPWPTVVIGAVVLLAIIIGVTTALLPTRVCALGGAVPIAGWAVGAQLSFQHGLWLPLVQPVAALTAATASVLLFRYSFVDRQRRFINTVFRQYLAPDLVNELTSRPKLPQLGGETRMLTVMFSDIRGFTAISETFKSDPQGLSRLINRGFLSPMSKLIMARRGTIDKYMGDCIMAFWNAPLDNAAHADNACDSTLAMVAELQQLNIMLAKEAEADGRVFHPINIGIGLNTGECVVGNMGSDERFAYTAMGDAVNLASRLEGQSKTYGVSIILSESTRAAAASWAALELDLIAVKGKAEAVRIFTLLGNADLAQTPEFQSLAEHHAEMLARYRAQDWAGARAALQICRGAGEPRLAGTYELYEERLSYFADNPPAPDWDGVFVALTK
jgi:adenylate cyclase